MHGVNVRNGRVVRQSALEKIKSEMDGWMDGAGGKKERKRERASEHFHRGGLAALGMGRGSGQPALRFHSRGEMHFEVIIRCLASTPAKGGEGKSSSEEIYVIVTYIYV